MMLDPNILERVRSHARHRLPGLVGAVHARSTLSLEAHSDRVTTTALVIAVEVALDLGCEVAEELTIPAHASGYMLESDQIVALLNSEITVMLERRARREVLDDADMRPTQPMLMRRPRGTPAPSPHVDAYFTLPDQAAALTHYTPSHDDGEG